jgi:hypothetical protein
MKTIPSLLHEIALLDPTAWVALVAMTALAVVALTVWVHRKR